MFTLLINDPWAMHSPCQSLSDSNCVYVDGRHDPRIVCEAEIQPWYRSKRNKLPRASFPFHMNGKIAAVYYLPTPSMEVHEADFQTPLGSSTENFHIIQENSVRRYTEEMPIDSVESAVNSWINRAVRLFQELGGSQEELAEDFDGIARRTWKNVAKKVMENGEQEALMSLIVQLASDRKLRQALVSISNTPRRVLERIREEMKISRIQQLDGACIRAYARRPGLNAAAKAGPRQKLLALNRIENTNTLENRVHVWVLKTIEQFSRKYVYENAAFSASARVYEVKRFGEDAKKMRNSVSLQGVSFTELSHPVQPNYPLQLDRRYAEIFSAYKKLRHEEKTKDDAWEWQRVLWSGVSRLLFYSLLRDCCKSPYSNFIYLKKEGIQGRWMNRGDAPGPLLWQKLRFYIIDAWDIHSPEEWLDAPELFPGAHELGQLGCDCCLYLPVSQRIMPVWFAFSTHHTPDFYKERQKSCGEALALYKTKLKKQNKALNKINGLILNSVFTDNASPELEQFSISSREMVYSLQIPYRSFSHIETLKIHIQKIMEGFTG
ncbi:MAG: DUF2357 domain-containing protein [Lentisphaeria bacterium]|nr:DUF2357 domain-containing protein [Lentisphaeria bacterium]